MGPALHIPGLYPPLLRTTLARPTRASIIPMRAIIPTRLAAMPTNLGTIPTNNRIST